MMRINVFEFEDFKWFPDFLRTGMMDYLRYFFKVTGYYSPVVPILEECLEAMNTGKIVDLCSGSGGPVLEIQNKIYTNYGRKTQVALTDLYPNKQACQYNSKQSNRDILCIHDSVDAMEVPVSLIGTRTLFSSIHHFDPNQVRRILADAVRSKQGIAIFDIGEKNLVAVIGILIFHPILILLLTPFFRPFHIYTIVFTYFIPLIPLFTVWDGIMSILRLYRADDLQKIADSLIADGFHWRSGYVKNRLGLRVVYLTGIYTESKS